jgi:predicted nucleic acid-binding protein
MGSYVIDANVLMAILISGKAIYKTIFTDYTFISSDFALIEIEKYKEIIQQKTKLDSDTFTQYSYFIFSHIHFFPSYIIKPKIFKNAIDFVEDIDIKDVAYISLAIQLDLKLITRDLPLYNGLRKKGFKNVILFDQFLRSI